MDGKVLLQTTTGADRSFAFPGGHVEIGETLIDAFKREIEEEIGIKLNSVDEPFLHIIHCTKNYRNTGKNRQNEIYYYLVKTEEEPHLEKTHFDDRGTDINKYCIRRMF